MTNKGFQKVLEANHDTRKQMVQDLAKQATAPREEAAIHQAKTTPVRAVRN